MTAIIDLDIVLYRCLFAVQGAGGDYYRQLKSCENTIEYILDKLQPEEFELVASGGKNFRLEIDENYKANRKDMRRPVYLYDSRKYFEKYWNAVVTNGVEADDYIASVYTPEDVIVSIDKDFMQLPATIFNWVKNEIFTVTNPMFHFWTQMLTGDGADNVPGVLNPAKMHFKNPPKFTLATAHEVLEGLDDNRMKLTVVDLYKKCFGDDWWNRFDTNARLLWLKRGPTDQYHYHL